MLTLQLCTARPSTITVQAPQSLAVAAIFGAGQVRRVAQRPQQGRFGVELVMDRLAVDGHSGHRRQASVSRAAAAKMMRWVASSLQAGRPSASTKPEAATRLPIVFLHGVGSDKSVWAPQLDAFRQLAPRGGLRLSRLWRERPGAGGDHARRLCRRDPVGDGCARDRASACLRPLARRSDRDRDPSRGARALRVADPRRHLRRPSRRAGDLRPLGRRQRRHARASPKRAPISCWPSRPTQRCAAK